MVFDSGVLVWALRGSEKAADLINKTRSRYLSIVSYMELLRGARNRRHMTGIKETLRRSRFQYLPLTESIGYRAAVYVEEYGLKVALSVADALIAATAVEQELPLVTGNQRHFSPIKDLRIKTFRPH